MLLIDTSSALLKKRKNRLNLRKLESYKGKLEDIFPSLPRKRRKIAYKLSRPIFGELLMFKKD